MLSSNFSNKFYILVYFFFFTDPTNILSYMEIGTGYKSIVKLKFCAQPMHQIFVIKYCILLKTSLSE